MKQYAHDDPELAAAADELRELRATPYVRELVAKMPPLSIERRHRLAVLLLADDWTSAGRS